MLRIGAQIGSVLAYAHARGVVHRDVKPGNILVDANGNAFLADFGLALLPDDPESAACVCGTPSYMVPEPEAEKAASCRRCYWQTAACGPLRKALARDFDEMGLPRLAA